MATAVQAPNSWFITALKKTFLHRMEWKPIKPLRFTGVSGFCYFQWKISELRNQEEKRREMSFTCDVAGSIASHCTVQNVHFPPNTTITIILRELLRLQLPNPQFWLWRTKQNKTNFKKPHLKCFCFVIFIFSGFCGVAVKLQTIFDRGT